MSQDTIVIGVIALIIVIGSCIGLARAGRQAEKSE
jgi:hypothetical protein